MFDSVIDLVRFLLEACRFVLGIWFGVLALSLTVVVRVAYQDNGVHEANRRVTLNNPLHVWSGNFGAQVDDRDNRTSQGVAFDLKTGKLEPQRRLSDDAIDDVIGRRV